MNLLEWLCLSFKLQLSLTFLSGIFLLVIFFCLVLLLLLVSLVTYNLEAKTDIGAGVMGQFHRHTERMENKFKSYLNFSRIYSQIDQEYA